METPVVTVICLCHNQREYVIQAIQSVLDQTYKNIQLIIVDDASSDGSQEVIQKFITDKPLITFIKISENVGNCKAFNSARQQIQGEYCIDLAADDILIPERVETGVRIFTQATPDVGVHFSDAELINERDEHLSYHSQRFPHKSIPQGNIYKELVERYFICSPTMMFRKSVLEKLNGYDESLSYEDFDFWIRSSRDFQYVYSPAVLVKKRILETSLTNKQFRIGSPHQRTTYRVCKKIFHLNRTTSEQQALEKRIAYEIRTNIRLLNLWLALKYCFLWISSSLKPEILNQQHCLNCSTTLVGTFCHSCGQKRIEDQDRTIKHFIYQFFGSAFFLENNFARNIWTLLTKPGRLTLDFIEGRRKRWMPPFSLFFLINIFYFWYSPLTDFNPTLREHITVSRYKHGVSQLVNEKITKNSETLESYSTRFDAKSTAYANTLVIIHVPLLAFIFSLIFFRNRYYFADHFIFALHLLGFILLLVLILSAFFSIDKYVISFLNPVTYYILMSLVFLSLISYLGLSIRTIYKRKWWTLLFFLPLLVVAVGVVHFFYRFLLFLIIYSIT